MEAVATTRPSWPAPRRWVRHAAGLALGAVAGMLFGLAIVAFVATRFFGFSLLAVHSDSMAPAIGSGDAIVVKPVAPSDIDVGDVILFQSGGELVPTVHRVVGINEIEARVTSWSTGDVSTSTDFRFATRGDANPAADPGLVSPERVLGRVWFTLPHAGRLFGVSAQLMLFTAAGAFATAWAGLEIVGRLRSQRAARY